MPTRRTFFLAAVAISLGGRAEAHSYRTGTIAIGHVWGLPSGTNETQVFAPFSNRGPEPDALVAARSSICSVIELRQNNRYDQPELQSIELLPGRPLAMRRGARHLRLVGLTRSLRAGDRFEMILDFLHAGEAVVEVMVEEGSGH